MQVTKLARQNSKSQDTVVPQLQLPACMMWAVTSFGYVLEKGDIFLTPEERDRAVELGLLYVRAHVALAFDALSEHRPRYKVRPRLHSFCCECILRMMSGSLQNPKHSACWSEEDYIGQTCSIGKAKPVHPATIGRRVLERLQMVVNAELAKPK